MHALAQRSRTSHRPTGEHVGCEWFPTINLASRMQPVDPAVRLSCGRSRRRATKTGPRECATPSQGALNGCRAGIIGMDYGRKRPTIIY